MHNTTIDAVTQCHIMQHSTTKTAKRQGGRKSWEMEKHVGMRREYERRLTEMAGKQNTHDLHSHLYVNLFVLQHLLQLHQAVFERVQF